MIFSVHFLKKPIFDGQIVILSKSAILKVADKTFRCSSEWIVFKPMGARTRSKRIQRKGLSRVLLGAISGIVIFTPLCVGPILGLTSLRTNSGIEQPSPTLDFDYLGKLSKWLAERAAMKDLAVRVDGEIDRKVFRESASAGSGSPRVIEGRADIAFIADAFNEACNPHIQTNQLIERMRMLSSVIEKTGRKFNLIVSPDKSTILSAFLPPEFELRKCFQAYNEIFWDSLQASELRGFINLRTKLLEARTNSRELLFKMRDTHWDNAGGSIAAKSLINTLETGIWEDKSIKFTGLIDESGDLDVLTGKSKISSVPTYTLVRPDVTEDKSDSGNTNGPGDARRFRFMSEKSSLITGRTLIMGDSFSEAAEPFFLSYFEDVTLMRLSDFSPANFIEQIKLADRVIFWSIERSFPYRVAYDWGTTTFIDSLQAKLK